MLILLSSGARKRYRDDILRCLAAPQGSLVQFRYQRKLVQDSIWSQAEQCHGQQGYVCSVDLEKKAEHDRDVPPPCRLVPVRQIEVDAIEIHGDILTVSIRMLGFAKTADVAAFTSDIDGGERRRVPRPPELSESAHGSSGKFFFEVGREETGRIQVSDRIADWQDITRALLDQSGYGDEPFFWTVLGLWRDTPASDSSERIREWRGELDANKGYVLAVHTYHPETDTHNFEPSFLRLHTELELRTGHPMDLRVDSPYDVKKWRFLINPSDAVSRQGAWFTIGPEKPGQTGTEWEIDLPVEMKPNWLRLIVITIVTGMLLSCPVILAAWAQDDWSIKTKSIHTVVALAACVLGVLVARLGYKKPL